MTWTRADNLAEHNKKIMWDNADFDKAAAMWSEGISASIISKALDGKHSRNSVISKMNRMGVQTPTAPVQKRWDKAFTPKPRVRKDRRKPTAEERVLKFFNEGLNTRDIACRQKVRKDVVIKMLLDAGLNPAKNDPTHYKVHPCWSMNDDDKRMYFYTKFMTGWREVQERLRG